MLEHLTERWSVEIQKGQMCEFLDVDLFRKIRCRVERRKQFIDVLHLITSKIGPASEGSSHFIQMTSHLSDRGFKPAHQSGKIFGFCHEMIDAEFIELDFVPISL